ncbi:MAG: flagellar basal-body MS-ring/collar protein FliF [Pseudomonadota bacterium]
MAEAALPVAAETAPPPAAPDNWRGRMTQFTGQPAFKRALPAIIGVSALAVVAALYLSIAQGPQRILYGNLSDGERAKVVETLEQGGIAYAIDNGTGMITVSEDDVYRARMLVASDAGLAAPQDATAMLDSIPLGSSRTLEGERLRLARERELMLTVREIDGIESVRVHLATPERSVFVRQSNPPSASVMVRLVSGRSLTQDQVEAIVNLVSGSVPGLSSDAVRVVDQNGRLLSSERDGTLDGLVLQREFESKLREQITALLLPLLGDGNFSSQVQVQLDQSEVTSARETYDPEGALRSETQSEAQRTGEPGTAGIPGVTANTPPPPAEIVEGAPDPAEAQPGTAVPVTNNETSARRDFELDREVAVTNTRSGGLVRLSVAVAVSEKALANAAPLTAEELQSLISAAVGADEERGDQVRVVSSAFESSEMPVPAFYEQPWFATVLRYVTAIIAVLLALLLGVRPLINRANKRDVAKQSKSSRDAPDDPDGDDAHTTTLIEGQPVPAGTKMADLPQQVELARKLAASQPDRAVEALQRMLQTSDSKAESR